MPAGIDKSPDALIRREGEMAARIAEFDWARTPLGPASHWPQVLRTAVDICVTSRFPMLVWWGPELTIIYNDAYRPMLGATKHPQALGAPGKAVWPEIWHVIGPMLEEVMAGKGATWSADQLLNLDRNGYLEECYFTFSYSPITDSSGAVAGVFCAVTETTEHVLSERRLSTLATLAGRLARATDESAVTRATTEVLAYNTEDHPVAAVLPASELPDVELAQADPSASPSAPRGASPATPASLELLPEPLRAPALALAVAALAAGRDQHLELAPHEQPLTAEPAVGGLHAVLIKAPGSPRPDAVLVAGHSSRRRWDHGVATYLTLCATHIATALSGIRALGTQQQRADALAALDVAKSAFFTNISHELRTPLTLIGGPVQEALADPALDQPMRERLEIVARNTTRLTRMVDALLDFDRIEAGRLQPHPEPLDVVAFTRQLTTSFAPAFERAGLDFEVDLPPEPHVAQLDRDMYERVVLNLIGNALKYTPQGRVKLELKACDESFEVSVSDTGVGIAAEDVERIFDRFEQLPRRTGMRSREGAGIGLAMVKELTGLLGGEVSLTSTPAVGSTFTVRFPWTRPSDAPTERSITPRHVADFLVETAGWTPYAAELTPTHTVPEARGGESPDTGASGKDSRVGSRRKQRPLLLIAEDNTDMRAYLIQALRQHYVINAVGDGQAALDAVRSRRPDLVLADVLMPVLDGFELTGAIRADQELADLPVVLISARVGDDETTAGLRAGADDYIVKPFSVRELRARLESNLERSRQRLRDAEWRRAVMHAFQDPLVISDDEGTVLEVNGAFSRLMGWSAADLPLAAPAPWWPPADEEARDGASGAEAVTGFDALKRGRTITEELPVVTRTGRRLWARVSSRGIPRQGDRPGFIVTTLRDVTREHDSRQRRQAAAKLSAEFGAAEDLEQVLMAAVSGFSELFDGHSVVRATAETREQVFTAAGPVRSDDLDPLLRTALDSAVLDDVGDAVAGLLIAPKGPGADCRVWVQFPQPRKVSTDERIVSDLLAQAFSLAVDRALAASDFADREAHLSKAIESHRLIGQAIGILIERHRATPQEAFTLLKEASQARNIKLREIAARVVETGDEPDQAQ